MRTFIQNKTIEKNPEKNGWYDTDKGKLYYFSDQERWSCRDDRMSIEYPTLWYEEF